MKTALGFALWGFSIVVLGAPVRASQPASEPAPERVLGFEELATLGEAVSELDRFKDNVYVYDEQIAATRQRAEMLIDAGVDVAVTVQRVTHDQVFVDVPDPGKTRIALKHATPPEYGNLRTVEYCGPPSAFVLRHFARRVSLRIGSEIELELAKTLRRGDKIVLRGRVESARVHAETAFCPIALVVISDWEVVGLIQNTDPIF